VDSAECSPTAAAEAAKTIKKYLDMKYHAEPQLQYNAVMLLRILADNPGSTFTRNLDERFAEKVKELFKQGRDPGVRQLLVETLEHFDANKRDDEGLQYLRAVWHKQKLIIARYQTQPMFHAVCFTYLVHLPSGVVLWANFHHEAAWSTRPNTADGQ